MNKKPIILVLVLLLLAGCVALDLDSPTIPPDSASIEYCLSLPNVTLEGFLIVNPNYCLGDPVRDVEHVNGIRQDSFDGYYAYSIAVDGMGRPPEAYQSTAIHAFMQSFSGTLEIFIQAGAGQWGVGQSLSLNRGCFLLSMDGETDINDRYNPDNYKIGARVFYPNGDSFLNMGEQALPLHSEFKVIFPFFVNSPQPVEISGYLRSIYGSAGENSVFTLYSFQVISVPIAFCGDN